MMSMQDMFYSYAEPVWIVKSPSEEEKKKQAAAKKEIKQEYSILNVIPHYPYLYPPYNTPAPSSASKDDGKKKETKVALRVSICCSECAESIAVALKELTGVKNVECNIRKEKVVVTCTTAAPADVILRSRRVFKDARLWTDDDE